MDALRLKSLDELKYLVIRKIRGTIFWLDDNGIVRAGKINELTDETKMLLYRSHPSNEQLIDAPNTYDKFVEKFKEVIADEDVELELSRRKHASWNNREITRDNHSRFDEYKYMIGMIKEGMTYHDLQARLEYASEHYNKTGDYSGLAYSENTGLDKYITKICKPLILRAPENPKTNTFDIIKVEVNLISADDRFDFIKKNKKAFINKVLDKLSTDKQYAKYGIPINFLRCTRIHSVGVNTVEVIFELKNITL